MDKKLHIEVYGRKYTLRGQADQPYADELASLVDQKMRKIAQQSPESPFSKLSILAAINIAHELVQLKRQHQKIDTTLDEKTRAMIDNIEEEFKAPLPK